MPSAPGGRSGVLSSSSLVSELELELLELELLLESSLPGSRGGRAVGNGWLAGAEPAGWGEPGKSGGVAAGLAAGFAGSPGNANGSTVEGFVSVAGGVQGLAGV